MLMNIIVIVLRETLEAGVLISLLLSIAYSFRLGSDWLWAALVLGVIGAWVYAANLRFISDWFNDVGQEVVNASLQYVIYIMLLGVSLFLLYGALRADWFLKILMASAVALAIIREGAELAVFYSGVLHNAHNQTYAVASGVIGLMIGISVGALCFYGLTTVRRLDARRVQYVALCLIGSGMVLQATQMLIQANWLPSFMPIWDTNWLLPESSVVGQLAYAVLGYEATPSFLELSAYVLAIVFMPLAYYIFCRNRSIVTSASD